MTTASNAIKACIEDNWNPATGGTEPTVYTSTEGSMWPTSEEWIFVKNWEYGKRRKRRNDSFVKEDDYVSLRVYTRNHADKEERLDELVNEIYRIVTPTNVTGYHKVDIIDQHRRSSDRRQKVYAADLIVELKILSTSSTATPGSTTTSTAEFDELTVNTSIAGEPSWLGDFAITGNEIDLGVTAVEAVLRTGTYGSVGNTFSSANFFAGMNAVPHQTVATWPIVKITHATLGARGILMDKISGFRFLVEHGAVTADDPVSTVVASISETGALTLASTLTTATQAQIDDLLMFGSANAAWINCPLEGWNPTAAGLMSNLGEWENVDATTAFPTYSIPLPTNRGGLKLYISGTRISLSDADAGDFITNTSVLAYGAYGNATFDTDATDKATAALHTDTFTALDVSAYHAAKIRLQTDTTDAGDLNIQYVLARVYYAA